MHSAVRARGPALATARPQELGIVITLNGPAELVRLRVDRARPSRFLASNFQLGAVFELVRGQAVTATAGLSGSLPQLPSPSLCSTPVAALAARAVPRRVIVGRSPLALQSCGPGSRITAATRTSHADRDTRQARVGAG
jgi:hypothetical protein